MVNCAVCGKKKLPPEKLLCPKFEPNSLPRFPNCFSNRRRREFEKYYSATTCTFFERKKWKKVTLSDFLAFSKFFFLSCVRSLAFIFLPSNWPIAKVESRFHRTASHTIRAPFWQAIRSERGVNYCSKSPKKSSEFWKLVSFFQVRKTEAKTCYFSLMNINNWPPNEAKFSSALENIVAKELFRSRPDLVWERTIFFQSWLHLVFCHFVAATFWSVPKLGVRWFFWSGRTAAEKWILFLFLSSIFFWSKTSSATMAETRSPTWEKEWKKMSFWLCRREGSREK